MQATLAIARLTFKAAFRYRLVPVLVLILLGGVFLLPAVIRHTGKAQEFVQIVLTYTLGFTTALLGLTTLWLACGTLAGDIEESHIQVVAVKPVARWQIWLGKWLGLLLINVLLLGLCAASIYGQLLWRARHLSDAQREVLQNEVLVARSSFTEHPPDLDAVAENVLDERARKGGLPNLPKTEMLRIIREQLKARLQVVPPGYTRPWRLDLSAVRDAIRDRPLYLRIKFFVSEKNPTGNYTGLWEVGPPNSPKHAQDLKRLAAETYHEFPIPPNLLDDQGMLYIDFTNQDQTALLFPLEDGLEVLYRAGDFGPNFIRGVAVVLCWLALLAAIGLAASSFLSFPVAAFLAVGLLAVAFSTSTMRTVIEQGTIREVDHDTGQVDQANLFDAASVAVFKGMLWTVNLVRGFSPIDSLSTGRTITWSQLTAAFIQIVLLVGGLFAALGMIVLTRRELATAQGRT
jgi:hypothetical protein